MDATPLSSMPRNTWRERAARMPSTAIWMLPPVPFLKPIGMLRPLATSRCVWLSVVRAPIAPHATRSPRYWGVNGSSHSVAVGRPRAHTWSRNSRAFASPALTSGLSFRCGSLMRPFQPRVVRGFSK